MPHPIFSVVQQQGGKIKTIHWHTVTCGCGHVRDDRDWPGTFSEFAKSLRLEGWRRIDQEWHCPDCLEAAHE